MKHYLRTLRPPGIRMQVMLWCLTVFVLLLLCADLVTYIGFKHALETNLDTTLQVRAQQLADGITDDGNTIHVNTETVELDTAINPPVHIPHPDEVNFGVLVRLLNAQGKTLRVSSAFRTLVVPTVSVTEALHGSTWLGTVDSSGGQEVRLYSMALSDNGKIFGVLQVGISLEQVEAPLRSLLLLLLLLVPALLTLGVFGSYWLAARAFRPIELLTSTAQVIEAGDLHRRVSVPTTRDEVYRLALTFNRMLERLEKAFDRQRRFVADASHELRTPTAVICSMAEMTLLKDATREECVDTLQEILAEAQRLGQLANDLLALARADEGQVRLEKEPVRLDALVQAVSAHLQPLAEEGQITLEVQTGEAVTLFGDEARLIQVILNLGENALRYTPPGGHVHFILKTLQEHAYLIVKDSGIGIAEQHLPHIFERFYRVDPARPRTVDGHSGLGLSIVEWIVRMHDGTIAVQSKVGQGSTFTITFPIMEAKSSSSLH